LSEDCAFHFRRVQDHSLHAIIVAEVGGQLNKIRCWASHLTLAPSHCTCLGSRLCAGFTLDHLVKLVASSGNSFI
jgi:hypothetical protein